MARNPCSQRGNALFLILIAVILFAALAYAISKSENGNAHNASQDKLSTDYSRVSSILNLATTNFMRLRAKGCAISDIQALTYDTPQNAGCAFFSKDGGDFPFLDDSHYTYMWLAPYLDHIGTDKPEAAFLITMYDTLGSEPDWDSSAEAICNYYNTKSGITYTLDKSETVLGATSLSINTANPAGAASTWPAAFQGHATGCIYDASSGGFAFYMVAEER